MDTMFFIIFFIFSIFLSAVEAHISYQLLNTLKLTDYIYRINYESIHYQHKQCYYQMALLHRLTVQYELASLIL